MAKYNGQMATCGSASGILITKEYECNQGIQVLDEKEEGKILESAVKLAQVHYEAMIEDAKKSFGSVVSTMVWSHQQLILDHGFHTMIRDTIKSEPCSVNDAIFKAVNLTITPMLESTDIYFKERANDVKYVAGWLARCCNLVRAKTKHHKFVIKPQKVASILVGENFGLEDIIMAKKERILGLIDKEGSIQSHAAMVAKELSIPMIVQVNKEIDSYLNNFVYLNATHGFVEVE